MVYPFEDIKLLIDNHPAIHLASHPVLHSKTKHIAIRYHKIREAISECIISLSHVGSSKQVADILTKPLAREFFEKLRDKMLKNISLGVI